MAAALDTIALLMLDVDGVLTDCTYQLGDGDTESRSFNARDGIGIVLARRAGLQVALVTSGASESVRAYGRRLEIEHVRVGVRDKGAELERLVGELGLAPAQVAFLGDDLVDLPPMRLAGVAMAVADAVPAVRDQADYVTVATGGHGAVREVCELLVAARDGDFLAEQQRCGLRL